MFPPGTVYSKNKQHRLIFFVVVLLLQTQIRDTNAPSSPTYTEVGGQITSNTIWPLAHSPYLVTSDVQVSVGVTLTIEPGVIIRFNRDRFLQIDGALIARGTPGHLVTFTSSQSNPQRGDWRNLKFTSTAMTTTLSAEGHYVSGSILQYCVVEYGGAGTAINGAIEAHSLMIDQCVVSNNSARGIYDIGTPQASTRITGNTIHGNVTISGLTGKVGYGGGLYATYGTINGNTVTDNRNITVEGGGGAGIYASYSTLNANTISGNLAGRGSDQTTNRNGEGGGLYAEFSMISGNIIKDNISGWISGSGGGIYAYSSRVVSNTVSGNYVCYGSGGGIYATGGTVEGNNVYNNLAFSGGGIHADGGLVHANIVYGNSVKGDLAGDGSGDGGGIAISGGGTASGNFVYNNGGAQDGGGVWVGIATASDNTISRNQAGYGGGIYLGNGGTATDNIVSDNLAGAAGGGIYALYDNTVSANIISGNSIPRCEYSCLGGGIFALESTRLITNTVTANSVNPAGQGSGIYLFHDGVVLSNTIVGNNTFSPTAIVGGVAGFPGEVSGNNIYGNSNYDVVGGGTLTNNYWGTTVSAEIEQHIYDGHDAPGLTYANYVPYLHDLSHDAPVPPPLNLHGIFVEDMTMLSWNPIPSTTTSYQYKIYYDHDLSGPPYDGTGANQGNSPLDVGNATSFTLTGLSGYHIAVTAYDQQERESWYSTPLDNLKRCYFPLVMR